MFSLSLDKISAAHYLRTHLDSRSATLICFLLALTNKLLIAYLYTDLEGDKSLYLLFTESLLTGHSLTEPVDIIGSVRTYVHNPAAISPLYSLLAAPFLWISRSYVATSFIVDVTAWSLFFVGVAKTARLILRERWLTNLFLLSIGFFIYPHELYSVPKDTLAVAFMLWSVYFAVGFLSTLSLRNTTGLCTALWLLGLTKYSYVPLFFVSFSLLFFFRSGVQPRAYRYHIAALFFVLIVAPCYWFFLRTTPANTISFIDDGTSFIKGFYPGNLLTSYPFVSSSILNTNFWGVQLEDIFNISFSSAMHFFRVLDILLIAGLCFVIFRVSKLRFPMPLLYVLLLSTVITGQLYLISLGYKAVVFKGSGNSFTYVGDARSFLFPIITLQLLFFYFLFKTPVLPRGLRNFLFLLFLIECFHGAYFTAKQMLHVREVRFARSTSSPVKKITTSILDLSAKGDNLHLVTSDQHLRRYATLNDIQVYVLLNAPCSAAALPTGKYLFATHSEDSSLLRSCFSGQPVNELEPIFPYVLQAFKKD